MSLGRERKSLILVTVDCLRADHCGFHGYSLPTTPFLDALAAESFVVPTAVVAGLPTYYSFPAILSSRMPMALGRDVVGLAPGETTLATALREVGFATAAFSAANPYISPHFGYEQGFDVFQGFLDFDVDTVLNPPTPVATNVRSRANHALKVAAHTIGLGDIYDELYFQYCTRIAAPTVASLDELRKFPSAEVIVDHAISWLDSLAPSPFFLWLHLMDPHSPYYPSAAAFRELTGRDLSPTHARYLNAFWNRSDLTPTRFERYKADVVELYDAGIRTMDRQVARLVDHLKQQQAWNKCIFALTADHGEEFLDHGGRYHAPVSLADEVARVPLMIRVPAAEKKVVPVAPFSHLHLAPTLLDALDVPPPATFRGRSLWRNLQQGTPWDDPAIAECVYGCTNPFRFEARMGARLVSVRDTRHKMVMRIEPGAGEELYDLTADPEEKRPVPASGERRGRYLKLIQQHLVQQHVDGESKTTDLMSLLRLKARLRDVRVELEHRRSNAS